MSKNFPNVSESCRISAPYQNSKILLNTKYNYKNLLEKDIKVLETDYLFKKSCGETELLPFIS